MEACAEIAERPPIISADEDAGGTAMEEPTEEAPTDAPITNGEGERYEAMNAVPAKVTAGGKEAAKPAKISKPELRR